MKAIKMTVMLCAIALASRAQDTISIDYQIGEKDTARNYVLHFAQPESAMARLKETWGKPAIDKAGTMRWLGASIEGYETKVNISLSDGLLTRKDENRTLYRTFKNERRKEKRLAKMQDNQERYTFIEFKAIDNTTLSQDEMDEYFFIETLEEILIPNH